MDQIPNVMSEGRSFPKFDPKRVNIFSCYFRRVFRHQSRSVFSDQRHINVNCRPMLVTKIIHHTRDFQAFVCSLR